MNKETELENYLSISPKKFEIYIFDKKNLKSLYKEELILSEDFDLQNPNNLKNFLNQNIFKIEKLSGKFVENIYLIIESEKILNIDIGIKKKNYNNIITKQNILNSLIEAKDLLTECYQNENILHMIINNFSINGKICPLFENNLESDNLALEIKFKLISNSIINDLNKILEDYQIKVSKYLDGGYVKSKLKNDFELPLMAHRIINGFNENEVVLKPKNPKKLAFFEKFFQLFS